VALLYLSVSLSVPRPLSFRRGRAVSFAWAYGVECDDSWSCENALSDTFLYLFAQCLPHRRNAEQIYGQDIELFVSKRRVPEKNEIFRTPKPMPETTIANRFSAEYTPSQINQPL